MTALGEIAALAALLGVGVGAVAYAVSARLRRTGVAVAYTRKVFHFIVFSVAAAVHFNWALPGTLVYGGVLAALVSWALLKGPGNGLYDALAREKDSPHQSRFIFIPMVTTALGGLIASLWTGPFASVGYLAAGWGDAVGEPAGKRWGRHPYRVPSLFGVPATRTLEGSFAVFLASTAGCGLALAAMGHTEWWIPLLCGAVSAVTEALSHHGLDNFTVQVVPSAVAFLLLG